MGFEDANALLQGGGDPIIKFAKLGDSVTGLLLDAEVVDQTTPQGATVVDEKTGRVKKQIIYTLQTELRDPFIEDDDGKRRVFAKWAIQQAITEALQEAGLEKVGLKPNGKLTITHSSVKPASTRGFSDMKLFEAKYEAPGLPSSTDDAPVAEKAPAGSTDLVGKYGQQPVDMALGILNGAPNTPLNVIAQASGIAVEDLQAFVNEQPF
jgi:hypothetical protein